MKEAAEQLAIAVLAVARFSGVSLLCLSDRAAGWLCLLSSKPPHAEQVTLPLKHPPAAAAVMMSWHYWVLLVDLCTTVNLLSCLWSLPTLQAVGQLRWLGLGGEPLPLPLAGQLQQLMAQPQGVVNIYGPTETTCNSNHWVVPSGCQGPMVIGQPCANFLQYVVDPGSLALLPVGAPGELLLSGPRVGAGYCGQPALTRERFIINPFKDQVSHHPRWTQWGMTVSMTSGFKADDVDEIISNSLS